MKKSYFNIFVDKILKKKGKLASLTDFEEILIGIMGENYSRTKAYKLIHQAKNKGMITSLKKDVYYILQGNEDENDIINTFYRDILHDHIKNYTDNKGLITGVTALQLYLNNYEIPDLINCITPKKQSLEVVVRDKKIQMKNLSSGKDNLYTTIKKTANKITIRNKSFLRTSLIISLMETLYANTENTIFSDEICKKIIRKYRKSLDWDELIRFLRKGKYHSSCNKLYYLARSIDEKYAIHIMDIIKKYSYRISR